MSSARESTGGVPPPLDVSRRSAAQLFDDHFDVVYRFCLSRTADPALAEDVAAQTFYEAARRLASDPTDPIDRRWLFVVAKRRMVDGWRRQERQRRLVRRIRSVGTESPGPIAQDDGVVRALASLPDRQRRAIVLRYVDELPVDEVADALGVTYQAAESLLARGRRRFAEVWKEQTDASVG